MNRLVLTVAAACTTLLAACGGTEVVVQAQIEDAAGEPNPINGLEIRFLPYDRNAVFDSLRNAYSVPEPQIPTELQALQDSIAQAQTQWSTAEAQWGAARDSLKVLSDRLKTLSPASGEYVVLFREFGAQEQQEASTKRTSDAAFRRFTDMQSRFTGRAEETRMEREQWGDAAYADVDQVLAAKLKASKRQLYADTTGESGVIRRKLPAGDWWVHARYELPFQELYWNVPIKVEGEQAQVQLTRQTAELRPKF
ncbi:MAG TPA: hypothetical protein VMN60_03680 [Longimicrobiales bacterium]|nr:hypothetical protein [Longimicrobiales bacterium]